MTPNESRLVTRQLVLSKYVNFMCAFATGPLADEKLDGPKNKSSIGTARPSRNQVTQVTRPDKPQRREARRRAGFLTTENKTI